MIWSLELAERCERYKVLPGPGGAYDQDEYLMMAMEQAAGVSALFDANATILAGSEARMALHTRLMLEAEALVAYINEKEKHEQSPAGTDA